MKLIPGREQSTGDKIEEQLDNCCPSLTWTQRMIGFGITAGAFSSIRAMYSNLHFVKDDVAGLGLLVTIVSFFQFGKLLNGNASPFALCYTIGNILSLCATMFLVGKLHQIASLLILLFCTC
jgi:hypothetical protein